MTNTQIDYWNNELQIEETVDKIRERFPNVSIPDGADLSIIGYSKIASTPLPDYNRETHFVMKGVDTESIKRTWKVYPLPQEDVDLILATKQKQLQESIVNKTQERLDTFAKANGYDSILSACTYADSVVLKFAAEGKRCKELRDTTWLKAWEILSQVQQGLRAVPSSFEDIESELPALTWN